MERGQLFGALIGVKEDPGEAAKRKLGWLHLVILSRKWPTFGVRGGHSGYSKHFEKPRRPMSIREPGH